MDPRSWRVAISIVGMVDSLAREVSHGKAQALRRGIETENRAGSPESREIVSPNLSRRGFIPRWAI